MAFEEVVIRGLALGQINEIFHHAKMYLQLTEERLKRHRTAMKAHRSMLLDSLVKWHDAQSKASDSSIISTRTNCGPQERYTNTREKECVIRTLRRDFRDGRSRESNGMTSPPYDGQGTLGSCYEKRETTSNVPVASTEANIPIPHTKPQAREPTLARSRSSVASLCIQPSQKVRYTLSGEGGINFYEKTEVLPDTALSKGCIENVKKQGVLPSNANPN